MGTVTKRGKRFRAMVRKVGHEPQYQTFASEKEAKVWMRNTEKELDERDATNPKVSIEDLIDQYEKTILPKRQMADSHSDHDIPAIKRQFKGMKMSDLQGRGLINWVTTQTTAASTSHWHIARLCGVLKQAEIYWNVVVPWNDIKKARDKMMATGVLKLAKERERRCSDDEMSLIKEHLSKDMTNPWPDFFEFCRTSAMRVGEVVRIEWKDFDEANRTLIVRDRKHPTKKFGNHQTVPLINGAFELIKKQRKRSNRIWPTGKTYASRVFHAAVLKAGIEDMVLHDLRHEGISRLFEAGYEIQEVALISGHTEWKTLARYTHLAPASVIAKEARLKKAGTPQAHETKESVPVAQEAKSTEPA